MTAFRSDHLRALCSSPQPNRACARVAQRRSKGTAHAATAEQAETYLGEKFEKFPNAPDAPLSGRGPEAGKPARGLRLKELDHVAVECKNLPRMQK